MRVIIPFPPSHFDDALSEKACKQLKAPVIPASEWVPLRVFLALPIHPRFNIADHWQTKRLHTVVFIDMYNEAHYYFHLHSVRKLVEKELRKREKRGHH